MSMAADEEILQFALGKNSVVVTLDADFHAILAVSGAAGPSVIRIRMQGLRTKEIVDYVRTVSMQFARELEAGSLVTVNGAEDHMSQAADRGDSLKGIGASAKPDDPGFVGPDSMMS